MRLHASPETASMPSRIGAPPVACCARWARSGPSVNTTSAPSAFNWRGHIVAAHDIDGSHPLRLGEHDQMAADRRIGDILDHPVAGFQRDVVFEQQQCRRRVDAQHRRLREVEAGGQRDRVSSGDTPALHPILALHVDDEIARPDVADPGADRRDAADAFRARCGRQWRVQPVIAAAERDIGGVDRKRQHVEDDLARRRRTDIGRLDAVRDVFRSPVIGDLDLFHLLLPVGQWGSTASYAHYAPDPGPRPCQGGGAGVCGDSRVRRRNAMRRVSGRRRRLSRAALRDRLRRCRASRRTPPPYARPREATG